MPETNNINIGKYTFDEAARWVDKIFENSKTLNYSWRPEIGDGNALEKISQIYPNIINIKTQYDFMFRGEVDPYGASDETVAILPNPLLEYKDRFDNMNKPREKVYALATYSQPWDEVYAKYTITEGEFNKVSRSGTDVGNFLAQQMNDENVSFIRTKNALALKHINCGVDFALKTFGSTISVFDPSKDYKCSYVDSLNVTNPTYLKKDENGTEYGVLLHTYPANTVTSWDEAIEKNYLVKFNIVSRIARPGSGASDDLIKNNCENFIYQFKNLLSYFALEAKEGRTLSGLTNSNDTTKMTLVLFIKPEIKNILQVKLFNSFNESNLKDFAVNFMIVEVSKFTNDKVYAMLCDMDYIFIKSKVVRSGVDVSYEGGFANHIIVYKFGGKTMAHKYVHLFMDPETSSK